MPTITIPRPPQTVTNTAPPTPTGGVTMAGQDKLPHLPVPPLEDTMKRYVRALESLQSKREHERTKRVVSDFLANDGPKLQKRLEEYASTRASFIEEWWTESYLSHEDSVVLNLNPFFIFEDDPTPSRGNQLTRAASIIMASLAFIHDLREGVLEPDSFRGKPLDMSQYLKLFGTARIPTRTGCKLQVDAESRHIVIMRRGQFYWFDVLDAENRPCLTERALLSNLKSIITDADETPKDQVAQAAIGVLSTEKRRSWARSRRALAADPDNATYLDVLDRALFVVCLDDAEPESISELAANMLCGTYRLEQGVQVGTCTNRYYDKLQVIVCGNGAAGINFEHSGVDGHTVLRYAADVYTELILRFAQSINAQTTSLFRAKLSPHATGGPGRPGPPAADVVDTTPRKLEWAVSPALRMAVRFAETRLSDLICQNECVALEFSAYGKNTITQYGFSPDAFVQMAFQATYFSLYGRLESVYEPAMTKAFLHGRTEAIRSVSAESVGFVKTFCSDAPDRDKVAALRAACTTHSARTRECMQGLGQDRVLYAMYCLAQQGEERGRDKAKGGDEARLVVDAATPATPETPLTPGALDPSAAPTAPLKKTATMTAEATSLAGAVADHLERTLPGDAPASDPVGTTAPDSPAWTPSTASDAGDSEEETSKPRVPALFTDAGYATLGHSILSTSNCGNPALRLFGFGAVVPDGFGIGYIIKDDSMSFCVASKHLQTPRFLETLRAYFVDAYKMIKRVHDEANRRPDPTFIDHTHGVVDAYTGSPMHRSQPRPRSPRRGHKLKNESVDVSLDDPVHFTGYGFYSFDDTDLELDKVLDGQRKTAQPTRIVPGTRIRTVELQDIK